MTVCTKETSGAAARFQAVDYALVTDDRVRKVSRRLRDLCEPIAGSVYFVPEAQTAYGELGFENYAEGYFSSRGACLGTPSGEVVTRRLRRLQPGHRDPGRRGRLVATDRDSTLAARSRGATSALERVSSAKPTQPVVEALRPVMESVDHAGRMLFAGLRSLPFPDDPITQLWRVCDYVRERRGDGHIAAWVGAGCDAIEISLLTELFWGLGIGTYVFTRGWTQEESRPASSASRQGLHQRRRSSPTPDASTGGRSRPRPTRWSVRSSTRSAPRRSLRGARTLATAVLDAGGYPVNPARR